ncbi:MAG TPA: zinc-binding dehydrogenase [Planctomycetota bacterium]|jgi:NADPH2:quinone reductase|nr:zinc-binding dehydrogenase [Planctomycetota bacterium]
MQAVEIPAHGPPSVLRIVDRPRPTPAAGEVLVKMIGVSINHLDLFVRAGMPGVKLPLPLVPGCDGIGEIAALGSGVTGLATGQRVVVEPGRSSGTSAHDRAGNDHLSDDYQIRGEHFDGLAREYVAVESRFALPLPAGVDPVRAAAVPLVFLTAWGMLVTRARVQPGETVLVIGGTSGVGSAAIQIARDAGARVIATAGSEAKLRLCRELGAEEAVDHTKPDWGQTVRAFTQKRGVDVVVEHVGPATWDTSMKVLARNGRLVTCGGTTGPNVTVALPHLFIKNQSILGSTMGPRSAFPAIFERVAKGVFKPVVDRVMPMSRIVEAHELLESRKVLGKIVLTPGS